MKTKLVQWLYNHLLNFLYKYQYTPEQKKKINLFRNLFRNYFEGYDEYFDPILIKTFEITDFIYTFEKSELIVIVVLCRPGLLIGKSGKTIDRLNNYLSNHNMKVDIKESKLWHTLR